MSQERKLKPCPFCGGNAALEHNDEQWYWIECASCGASTNMRVSAMDNCTPLLIEQWNRRVTTKPETQQPAPAVLDKPAQSLTDMLTDLLHREMPEGTIIGSPDWWARKIARAIKSNQK